MWETTFFVCCFSVGVLIGYGFFKYSKMVSIALKKVDPLHIIILLITVLVFVGIVGSRVSGEAMSYANLGLTGILVFVTIVYALITNDILRDGKKAREIEFMQKQLECFYYPWLRVMEDVENASLKVDRGWEYEGSFYMHCLNELSPVLRKGDLELHKYSYLANEDIRGRLLQIEQYMGFKRMEIDPELMEKVTGIPSEDSSKYMDYIPHMLSYHEQEFIFDTVMSFKAEIESEIDKLNNKLIGLIK